MLDREASHAASLHPRHPFPEYAPHVDLIERLASERFFRYEVCPNGHVRQTPLPDERYPCSEFSCGLSVRAATRWFAETLRHAERGLTWIGDRL